ncbi:hypothetical protein LJU02_06280 [Corynebacterium pseudotuberculosis]|uniref:hypothetical protein n=1 Tax=Corynebacterium pseudotuberculosis TaxID=1719 RepID=UPI000232483F|nr:hypothetical protein [Corynebacterium pseudotuberculosis]AER69269.1 Hypothetical protein Cp106_1203 [Corynebacterium pseudotuberculosis 1/06-A]AFB72579.1 hypothetical protein CP316_06345 [Corynebacterium pseudotuberculosis 316]AFH91047.1 hypothetical protein CP31_06575 [Corynebacterium pseudotuberculosis 31]AFM07565.1 hypothetical protein CP162_04945 [Corynebacterium pseudotuberculosis Cp162]AKS13565.1 Hypothetical protein CpE19_1227 [Corynebacterium pseudotuberculosis]
MSDRSDESGKSTGDHNKGGADDFRPYPEVNHPEDKPDFPYGVARSGENQTGSYNGYSVNAMSQTGDAADGYVYEKSMGREIHPDVDRFMVTSGSQLRIKSAIKYGFGITFSRPLLWIFGTFIFFLIVLGGSISVAMTTMFSQGNASSISAPENSDNVTFNIISSLIGMFLAAFLYQLLLRQIDGKSISFSAVFQKVNYWPTTLTLIVISVINFLILLLCSVVLGINLWKVSGALNDPQLIAYLLGGMAVYMFISLLIQPFVNFSAYYAADRRGGVKDALLWGVATGKKHYLRILGFLLLTGLISLVLMIFTLGLGMVIVVPAMYNATAHAYRQLAGGPYPKY